MFPMAPPIGRVGRHKFGVMVDDHHVFCVVLLRGLGEIVTAGNNNGMVCFRIDDDDFIVGCTMLAVEANVYASLAQITQQKACTPLKLLAIGEYADRNTPSRGVL